MCKYGEEAGMLMARSDHISTILFWLMMLAGAAALVPCVLLPPLFDYHAQQTVLETAEQRNSELRERLASTEAQIEAVEGDPAYLERLARQEFGTVPPGVRTIPISTEDDADPKVDAAAVALGNGEESPGSPADIIPDISTRAREMLTRYPLARVFVWPETRPVLMLLGGVMLVSAVVLLGNSRQPAKPVVEDEQA